MEDHQHPKRQYDEGPEESAQNHQSTRRAESNPDGNESGRQNRLRQHGIRPPRPLAGERCGLVSDTHLWAVRLKSISSANYPDRGRPVSCTRFHRRQPQHWISNGSAASTKGRPNVQVLSSRLTEERLLTGGRYSAGRTRRPPTVAQLRRSFSCSRMRQATSCLPRT